MATINVQRFCDGVGEQYAWDSAKVTRLRQFLSRYGSTVEGSALADAMVRFVADEDRREPPPGAPLTDTS